MDYHFDELVDRRHTESLKWRLYGDGVLPMWLADMDFRSPEPVIRALAQRVEHGVFGYGMEPEELREVLVERLARLYGWKVAHEAIVFLPGVVIGFRLACRAVAEPGDGVLVQTPVYPPIFRAWRDTGLCRREMELTRGPDGHYSIDFDAFERAIDARTRIFILCNPHNPVGRVFRDDELARMAEICLRHGVTICSDEIHGDLIFAGHRHRPIASLAPEVAERTVTLMAPSKTFNIAGLTCAFAVVPNPDLRERLCAAQAGLVGHPNILDYTAALAAYRHGQPWLEAVLEYLQANRDYVVEYVRSRLPGIGVGVPEGTYLAWLDCRAPGLPGGPHRFFLERARVAMNDGADFGTGGEGFVRLNFGCPRPLLAEALDRMRAALATL